MTRRVIQTDLFAAFKESQNRAEESFGKKRSIKIEGTGVRKVDTHKISKNPEFELIQPEPNVATLTVDEALVEPKISNTTPPQNQSPKPSETVTQKVSEPPQKDRVTISYKQAQKDIRENAERLTVDVKKEKKEEPPQPVAAATPPASTEDRPDHNMTLLWVALFVLSVIAAYIVGQKTTEPTVITRTELVPTPTSSQFAVVPMEEEEMTYSMAVENNTETEEAADLSLEVTTPEPVQNLGRFTIQICSGISTNQAQTLSAWIETQSDYPIFVRNGVVYAGRFEKLYEPDINTCQEFFKNLKYEGRKQFLDAFQVNLPQSLME